MSTCPPQDLELISNFINVDIVGSDPWLSNISTVKQQISRHSNTPTPAHLAWTIDAVKGLGKGAQKEVLFCEPVVHFGLTPPP